MAMENSCMILHVAKISHQSDNWFVNCCGGGTRKCMDEKKKKKKTFKHTKKYTYKKNTKHKQ